MTDGAGAEAGAALRAELARVRGQMAAAIIAPATTTMVMRATTPGVVRAKRRSQDTEAWERDSVRSPV